MVTFESFLRGHQCGQSNTGAEASLLALLAAPRQRRPGDLDHVRAAVNSALPASVSRAMGGAATARVVEARERLLLELSPTQIGRGLAGEVGDAVADDAVGLRSTLPLPGEVVQRRCAGRRARARTAPAARSPRSPRAPPRGRRRRRRRRSRHGAWEKGSDPAASAAARALRPVFSQSADEPVEASTSPSAPRIAQPRISGEISIR